MISRLRRIALSFGLAAFCAYSQYSVPTFHGDRQRTGWISRGRILTPVRVSGGSFGPIWNSPPLDSVTIGGLTYPPHFYASPLYVDSVTMTGGEYAGMTFHVVYAGSSNGFVYAVNAVATTRPRSVAAGTVLWRIQLNTPTGSFDGGIPLGILGTPAIDLAVAPYRLYVASADAVLGWQVFAIDIANGSILPGWPLNINGGTLGPINQNGPATWQGTLQMSQRGGLNLSPDGRLLYVPFGAYNDLGAGWMVAVDTQTPALASAFSGPRRPPPPLTAECGPPVDPRWTTTEIYIPPPATALPTPLTFQVIGDSPCWCGGLARL
jgi:hypothetical protein